MTSRRMAAFHLTLLSVLLAACPGGDATKTSGAFGSTQVIEVGPGESYEPTGPLVADLGFRPERDGFAFQNYGEGPYENMTADDVRSLFGDRVCAYLEDDVCELTPPAAQWMEQTNLNMSGGHCYGFSVASLLFFAEQQDPADFGGATTPKIALEDNEAIQRLLATTWAFQVLPDITNAVVTGTPNEILDSLIASLKPDAEELYTVGIYQADGTGGHAITPLAVEDRGDGTFAVLVYDNNYPAVTRAIVFDREANAWGYNAATNPEEPSSDYIGDAETGTISLYPTTPALDTERTCPFCEGEALGSSGGNLGSAKEVTQIILTGNPAGHGRLLVTDEEDRRVGWVDDTYVNEIPGAKTYRPLMDVWDQAVEPVIEIPAGTAFEVTIDGSTLERADTTSVSVIGAGFELAVEDINLGPGQVDTLLVTADGASLAYTTKSDESPFIDVGIVGDEADYEFAIVGVDMVGGGVITAGLDLKDEILVLTPEGKTGGTYGLGIRRIDDEGEQVFAHDDIALTSGDVAGIVFGKWANDGSGVPLVISGKGGDETIMLTDEGNTEYE